MNTEIQDIKERHEQGYFDSIHDSYQQMDEDIKFLLNLFDAREKQVKERIEELEAYKMDLIKDGFYVTAEDFSSRKQELKSLLESWTD